MQHALRPLGERGFSLLEVMVAGSVLAVALLGLAALAARSLQDAADALDHRVATALVSDLQARLTLAGAQRSGHVPAAAAAAEFAAWQAEVRRLLPGGEAGLCLAGAPVGATPFPLCGTSPGWEAAVTWRRAAGAEAERQTVAWAP